MKNYSILKSNLDNLAIINKIMSNKILYNFVIFSFVLTLCGQSFAQEQQPVTTKKINFGYSKNPDTKPKKQKAGSDTGAVSENNIQDTDRREETAAKKTLEVVKKSNANSLPPTEIYRIGVGDILFISLQNAPAKESTYFTVLNDGNIDYPLAGALVPAAGLTTDDIEELLRDKIELYENPQVSVRVRDYSSHRISVLGLVEKAGEKFIQREAVPLFVIKAEAIVKSDAEQVIIRRADLNPLIYSLNDQKTDEILIYANDIVEFTIDKEKKSADQPQFYFVGGAVVSGGQKDFHRGLTLSQAVMAAGGLRKPNIKQVVVRRKNAEGLLVPTTYNLKDIKDGKIPDPQLEAGDTVEVGD